MISARLNLYPKEETYRRLSFLFLMIFWQKPPVTNLIAALDSTLGEK